MIDIKIVLNKLITKMPRKSTKPSLSQRVQYWMDKIEAEQDSERAWKHLTRIYNHLRSPECKYSHKEQLLEKLVPFLAKYGDMSELKDHKGLTK